MFGVSTVDRSCKSLPPKLREVFFYAKVECCVGSTAGESFQATDKSSSWSTTRAIGSHMITDHVTRGRHLNALLFQRVVQERTVIFP